MGAVHIALQRSVDFFISLSWMREIIGKRTCSSTGCLKTKEGSIIMDKKKILERWAEYMRELFEDNRKEHNVMKNFAGPPIMKDEV